MGARRHVTGGVVVVALAALLLVGCLGSDRPEPAADELTRVDSTAAFQGAERAVARVLEEYEATVLADDAERLCGALLAVRENRGNDNDNGGRAYCEQAHAMSPTRVVRRWGGEDDFDLVVRNVAIERRQRLVRSVAVASIGDRRETFELVKDHGSWEITAQGFGRQWLEGGAPQCGDGGGASISISYFAGRDGRSVRGNLLASPFGDRIRRTVRAGGSLVVSAVSYLPDYLETWVLRDRQGRIVHQYPVTVWGPRSFDTSTAMFCGSKNNALRGTI
jgi:hypothetical protein